MPADIEKITRVSQTDGDESQVPTIGSLEEERVSLRERLSASLAPQQKSPEENQLTTALELVDKSDNSEKNEDEEELVTWNPSSIKAAGSEVESETAAEITPTVAAGETKTEGGESKEIASEKTIDEILGDEPASVMPTEIPVPDFTMETAAEEPKTTGEMEQPEIEAVDEEGQVGEEKAVEPKVNEENENDLAISSDEVGELDAEPEMEESQIEVTGDESALEVIDFESWHPDTDDDNTEVEKKNDLEGLLAGHQKFADLLTLTAQFRTIGDDLERTRKKAA